MLRRFKARHTHHYVAIEDGLEVAFLALDQIPGVDYLVLYEIFVRPKYRRRGIGSRLLRKVEELAAGLGYERITLSPSPLEQGILNRNSSLGMGVMAIAADRTALRNWKRS
ncbi:hypothetical protein CWO90_34695 [Bradyrhizobium sp. Leo121]|nr:hypothetical protein CWO90_34695 [Bradyrhizobium sp. Leo121]